MNLGELGRIIFHSPMTLREAREVRHGGSNIGLKRYRQLDTQYPDLIHSATSMVEVAGNKKSGRRAA